ncbi:MAG: MMPL family transporter [Chloroflexia bacterium]|nr:MMPL family transporter [Chloroflexia bacterium]
MKESNWFKRILNIKGINNWFEKLGKNIVSYRWLYVLSFVTLLVISIFGMTKMQTNPSMENWFLEDDPITIATNKFHDIFGNDDYAGVLVSCDDVFTTKNLTLIRQLCNELVDSVDFAENVTSITNVEFVHGTDYGMSIDQIIPEVIPVSQDSLDILRKKAFSKENFATKLLTKDSKQTFILLKFKPFPKEWKNDYAKMPTMVAGEDVMKIIKKEEYKSLDPKATGMPVVNSEITAAMGMETSKIMTIALSVAFVILLIALRSIKGVVVAMITSFSSILVVLGALGLTGYQFEPTFITMPAVLGIAVSIGYSIHFLNFYKSKVIATGNRKEAVVFAMRETGWPILFTALTTILALLSFAFIPLEFLWFIGVSCAGVVAASFIITITLTPALFSFGKNKEVKVQKLSGAFQNYMETKMANIEAWVNKRKRVIIASWLIITVASIYGATRIEVTSDHERTYGRGLECIGMFLDVAQSELGSLYSYNLTVEFPEEGMAKEPENLKNLEILTKEVQQYSLTKEYHL